MEITEVRVKLVDRSSERLRAFCSITLDGDFVIRDLKIIGGTNRAFVAMPSRKLADRCLRCGSKNHLRAKYCNECGQTLNENRAPKDNQGRAKLHADVAHPINSACRERIQTAVIKAYEAELECAKSPDYEPPKYDDFEDDIVEETLSPAAAGASGGDENEKSDGFNDYDSLIADLKRDAASRQDKQRGRPSAETAHIEARPDTFHERSQPPDQDRPAGGEPAERQEPVVEAGSVAEVSPPKHEAVDSSQAEHVPAGSEESPETAEAPVSSPPGSAPLPQSAEEDRGENDGFGAGLS